MVTIKSRGCFRKFTLHTSFMQQSIPKGELSSTDSHMLQFVNHWHESRTVVSCWQESLAFNNFLTKTAWLVVTATNLFPPAPAFQHSPALAAQSWVCPSHSARPAPNGTRSWLQELAHSTAPAQGWPGTQTAALPSHPHRHASHWARVQHCSWWNCSPLFYLQDPFI